MLSKLVVKNFKSIGEEGVDLELKPLTILVGPNGSGKSSIFEALLLLAQSINTTLNPKGNLINFESIEELVYKGKLERWLMIEFSPRKQVLQRDVAYSYSNKFVEKTKNSEIKQGLRFDVEVDADEDMVGIISTQFVGYYKHFGDGRWENVFESPEYLTLDNMPTGRNFRPSGTIQNVLAPGIFAPHERVGLTEDQQKAVDSAEQLREQIVAILDAKLFPLSALRGRVLPEYGGGQTPGWVGREGENLIPLLAFHFGPRGNKKGIKRIIEWAQNFGVGDLNAGIVESGNKAAGFEDTELHSQLNLALASQGARQIMPCITQLIISPPNSIVIIEEPEISLHPQSQVDLCKLFAQTIEDNKQILITTHSSFLLLALSNVIKEGLLKPNDVAIYDVEKTAQGTKAQRLELTKNGYIEGWVPSFSKIERELLKDWVKTLPEV